MADPPVPADPARLDDPLDTAPCGFVSFADDGTVRAANATLHALLGYAPDALVGRHVETLFGVPGRIFFQTHVFPMLRLHGRVEEIFLLLRPRDGGELGALLNAVRRERGGEPVSDCVFMVVRERRKFEDALLQAKRAAEEAHAALATRTRELEHANELLEQQAVELEVQHQQLEDQAVELMAATEALEDANADLIARAEELERARAAADEANHAKSQFLATMSHELRTPLNAIGGYAQLLELGIHGPITDEQREALSRIARSQRHLLRLINEVLNLARIESGRVEYAIEEAPVADIVAGVLPMVEPQLAAKGIVCRVDVRRELRVRTDQEKAQQVLLNLLTNALKFTPSGGEIVVDALVRAERGAVVYLRVTDTGIGIPADKQERIFEPFVQVDASHTRRNEGTGLGLAISRDLARGMGGDLRARSVEGKGSTFTFALPRA